MFAAPSSEYVAGFIGMGNRLELHDAGDGWRLGDTALLGAPPVDAATGSVVLRLRSDDLAVRTDRTVADREVGFEAEVVLVTFGGRHVDVVLAVGDQRLDAEVVRPPAGLAAGDRVLVTFDPRCAAAYDADGILVDTGAGLPAAWRPPADPPIADRSANDRPGRDHRHAATRHGIGHVAPRGRAACLSSSVTTTAAPVTMRSWPVTTTTAINGPHEARQRTPTKAP